MKYQFHKIEIDHWHYDKNINQPGYIPLQERCNCTIFAYPGEGDPNLFKFVFHWELTAISNENGRQIFKMVAEQPAFIQFDAVDHLNDFDSMINSAHLNLQMALSDRTKGTFFEPYQLLALEPEEIARLAETILSCRPTG